MVDADHDVQHIAHLHRRGDDHPLGAAVEVALQRLRRQELAGAFQHQVNPQFAPGNLGRRGVRREAQALLADAQRVLALRFDGSPPATLHAVEFEQVGSGGGAAAQFVEVQHLQAVAAAWVVRGAFGGTHSGTQRQAADPAHAVDADLHVRAMRS